MEDSLNKQNETEIKDESIDFKAIFFKILLNWKIFIISFIATFSMAFVINKYTVKTYEVKSLILVEEDSKYGWGNQDFIQNMSFFNGKNYIENEMAIIKSYKLIEKVVNKLELNINYYRKYSIFGNAIQLFNDTPFKVIFDSNHTQTSNIRFEIKYLSENQINLKAKSDFLRIFDPLNEKKEKYIDKEFETNVNLNIDEWYENEWMKFKIVSNNNIEDPIPLNNLKSNDYYFTFNSLHWIILSYQSRLIVHQANKEASIIEIRLKGSSIDKEADFLNMLATEYIQSELDEKNLKAEKTIEFVENQISLMADTLKQIEEKLKEYRKTNKILNVSISANQILEKLKELETERAKLVLQDKYFEYLLEYLNENKSFNDIIAPSIMGVNDNVLNSLITELNTLYLEKSTLSEKHPYVNILEKQIQSNKSTLKNLVNSMIETSKISVNDIEERIKQVENEIHALPETERQLVNIEREFKVNDEIYTYLMTKRVEAGMAKSSNIPDNKILDEARLASQSPVSPKKTLNYLIAIVFGIFLPTIYLIIINYFKDTIESKRDLTNLTSIPILGVVGHSNKKSNLIVNDFPKSPVAESFRSLRTNLQFMTVGKEKNVIAVTSSISGEGKTFTSINMANVFSISKKSTIIIGCDLRRPKIFGDFELSNENGLSKYLIGQCTLEQIIQKTKIQHLDLISAGPVPPNPAELLETQKMNNLIEKLKTMYDYIVLDTPPITLVTDALLLTKYTDAVIYVVRQNYTKKETLTMINDLHSKKKISNLSLVVNDVQVGGYGYSYGYSYGYGYGYGYGYTSGYTEVKKRSILSRLFKTKKQN